MKKIGIECKYYCYKYATLNIDADDVTWLKIVPGVVNPDIIKVDESLKIDSLKITSWNTKTNDYVFFSEVQNMMNYNI